jgi:thiosulfate/3-mercaptopyruvate sulfurtransferase
MLVTPAWLADHLNDDGLVVVDMRWDEDGRGRARFEEGHIAGARFLDWASDLVDPDHPVAFMLAPPERFAAQLERRGISDATVVVAYADAGHSGPFRLWLGCRAYGHEGQVRILDGGIDAWLAEGRPLTTEVPPPCEATWTPRPSPRVIASAAEVEAAATDPETIVLDSREPAKFRGETVWFETGEIVAGSDGVARTPRGDLRAGRIPWAHSLPWALLYHEDSTMKSPHELRELFAGVGAGSDRRAIAYCGVGISAAALLYALDRAGVEDAALYDAGWDEWGRDARLPVARG